MMLRPQWLSRSDLGRSLWTFRREFVWVGIFSLFANLLLLAPTLYMLQIFDRIFVSQNEWTLIALSLIVLVFFAALAFSEWVRSRLLVRAGVRFDEFLNARVFGASFEANLNQASHNPVQAFSDLVQVRQFLTGNGVFAFFDTPWTPIYLVVLFFMHPVLGWTSVGFVVLLTFMAWAGHRLTARRHAEVAEGNVQSSTYLAAKLRNAETVQAMGMLGNLRRQWLALYDTQIDRSLDAQRAAMRVQAFVKFMQYTQQSIILAVGAWLAVRGEISAGAMIASNALMANALRPIGTLAGTWKQFVDARASWGRLETLLEEHPERATGRSAADIKGQVTLRDLVASAPNRDKPILKGLNAHFEAGEVVGIVGPSGAGKSTLARCLLGIWPQTSGAVLLDGHPVRDWARDELGPHLGYLPQDIEMFDGSIAENIARFGQINSDRIIEAAQRTGIHDMILRLPQGYDTPMGMAGSLLSGGQRQRIGLARAIYGSPALVVLDEPNANLDDVGLTALVRTIQTLKAGGSTVFLIVHQKHLLSVADRILVLNDGVITQLVQTRTASA